MQPRTHESEIVTCSYLLFCWARARILTPLPLFRQKASPKLAASSQSIHFSFSALLIRYANSSHLSNFRISIQNDLVEFTTVSPRGWLCFRLQFPFWFPFFSLYSIIFRRFFLAYLQKLELFLHFETILFCFTNSGCSWLHFIVLPFNRFLNRPNHKSLISLAIAAI